MDEKESLNEQPLTQNNDGSGLPRPKLKKIKRPKIRPSSDIPVAPSKLSPDEANIPLTEEKQENTSAVQNDQPNTANGTDLITAQEAQSISTEQITSPYVLDALPPELEYISEDGEAFEAPDNSFSRVKVIGISVACLIIGLFMGNVLFSSPDDEHKGLELVAFNSEVPAGRPRCGMTEESQACVLYLMNCYKQELTGRNFFELAAQLTKRETYMIDSANIRYANEKIKPGYFVQLNIPALQ